MNVDQVEHTGTNNQNRQSIVRRYETNNRNEAEKMTSTCSGTNINQVPTPGQYSRLLTFMPVKSKIVYFRAQLQWRTDQHIITYTVILRTTILVGNTQRGIYTRRHLSIS